MPVQESSLPDPQPSDTYAAEGSIFSRLMRVEVNAQEVGLLADPPVFVQGFPNSTPTPRTASRSSPRPRESQRSHCARRLPPGR